MYQQNKTQVTQEKALLFLRWCHKSPPRSAREHHNVTRDGFCISVYAGKSSSIYNELLPLYCCCAQCVLSTWWWHGLSGMKRWLLHKCLVKHTGTISAIEEKNIIILNSCFKICSEFDTFTWDKEIRRGTRTWGECTLTSPSVSKSKHQNQKWV